MATFAKSTFNAARYAAVRPTYPPSLFQLITGFHRANPEAQWKTVVDLGCGTGQATSVLVRDSPFERVIAVDPSQKMLSEARSGNVGPESSSLKYVQATAETLLEKMPELEGQVDMITSGQAAHWFQYPQVYDHLKRLLRPQSGSFTFWGYSQFRFSGRQGLTPLIQEYCQGNDPKTSLGPHWERPGRTIVDTHFDTIPMPTKEDGFGEVKRVWYALPHHESGPEVENHPTIMKKLTTWQELELYLRTFSALHTFHEQNPEDKQLRLEETNGAYHEKEGDIAQRFLGRCQSLLKAEGGDVPTSIEIEWPLSIFMARRL